MIRYNLLILSLIFIIFAVGCSGNSTTDANSNVNAASAANQNAAINLNATNNSSNSNAAFPASNSGGITTPNMPANVAVKGDLPREPKTQMLTQSAPDDSQVTTALGENLVQTRVFKNNPRINKIESVTMFTDGQQKKVVKVYLKNGQVRELPESKVKDAMTETASNILKAIG